MADGMCPECGAELKLKLAAERCWLCGAKYRWDDPAFTTTSAAAAAIALPPRETRAGQFPLSGLFTAIATIAVGLGALKVAPGLGMLLAFAVCACLPIAVRARVLSANRRRASLPVTLGNRVLAIAESFFVTLGGAIVGGMAAGAVFFAAGISAIRAGCGPTPQPELKVMLASPVVGMVVAGLMVLVTWPKRNASA